MTNEKLNLYCATTVWLIVLCHYTMTKTIYWYLCLKVYVLCGKLKSYNCWFSIVLCTLSVWFVLVWSGISHSFALITFVLVVLAWIGPIINFATICFEFLAEMSIQMLVTVSLPFEFFCTWLCIIRCFKSTNKGFICDAVFFFMECPCLFCCKHSAAIPGAT